MLSWAWSNEPVTVFVYFLSVSLQDGHPDRLLCGLEVGRQLLLLDLQKNQ